MNILGNLIHLFFPRTCEVCNSGLLQGEELLCTGCLLHIPKTQYHTMAENRTTELFKGRVPVCKATSFMYYSKTSDYAQLLYHLKYKNKPHIGEYFGKLLGYELQHSGFCETLTTIVPVPLHRKRLRERGYNQSEHIARGIAKATGLAIDNTSIERSVYTNTQTKKTRLERWENVENIFKLRDEKALENKHILLVDDVITTGATIESLALSVQNVSGISISIASIGIVI